MVGRQSECLDLDVLLFSDDDARAKGRVPLAPARPHLAPVGRRPIGSAPAGRDPPIHTQRQPHCTEPIGARGRLRSHRTGGRSPTPTRRPHANGRTHHTNSLARCPLAVVLPDPTQPHPLLPPAATSPASRHRAAGAQRRASSAPGPRPPVPSAATRRLGSRSRRPPRVLAVCGLQLT